MMEFIYAIGGLALVLIILSFFGQRGQKGGESVGNQAFHRMEKTLQSFIFDVERDLKTDRTEIEQLRQILSQQQKQLIKLEEQYSGLHNIISAQRSEGNPSIIEAEEGMAQRGEKSKGQKPLAPLLLNSRYQPVLDQLQEGKTVGDIAQTLGMGVGEVELILQLSKLGERHED